MAVGEIISEGLTIHNMCKTKEEKQKKIYELLELVGLHKKNILIDFHMSSQEVKDKE